jgi:hypothetical protein
MPEIDIERINQVEMQFGGLRFEIYYTKAFGASTRLFGKVGGDWEELLRFDDFVGIPHYHQPASDDKAIMVAKEEHPEAMEFYLNIIANELPERLTAAGYADVLPSIDQGRVRANIELVRHAMSSVLPEGFYRVPGDFLQDSVEERTTQRAEMFAAAQAALNSA